MRWDEIDNLPCSIARSLSVVGDRWTLLVLRESFLGVRRFEEFQQRLGMARHRLSDRLARLVEHGVLRKELYPVMLSLVRWGDRWMDQGKGPPVVYRHRVCGQMTQPGQNCTHCGAELKAREVTPMAGPGLRDPKLKARLRA
jgi:DNA-binding HxlR family transcriptional regulator